MLENQYNINSTINEQQILYAAAAPLTMTQQYHSNSLNSAGAGAGTGTHMSSVMLTSMEYVNNNNNASQQYSH